MTDTTPKVNPRSIQCEGPWLPVDARGERRLLRLKELLADAGYGWNKIGGLEGWMRDKAAGRPDTSNSVTRSSYRRMIESLGDVDPDGPDELGARRRRRGGGGAGGGAVIELPPDADPQHVADVLAEAGIIVRNFGTADNAQSSDQWRRAA